MSIIWHHRISKPSRTKHPAFFKTGCAVIGLSLMLPISPLMAQNSFFDTTKSLLKPLTTQDTGILSAISSDDITQGLKEALALGVDTSVKSLGTIGGFAQSADFRIPLPDTLQTAHSILKPLGFGGLGEAVEDKLNQGAERAIGQSGDILADAIRNLTVEDAKAILEGPDNAATQYLQRQSGSEIAALIRPIIDTALSEVGALQAVDSMIKQYDKVPFVSSINAPLTDHATDLALEGLFTLIAREEAAIRANPAKRTTDLLKKVFSSS